MICVTAQGLAARLDGELTENEARAVDTHVARCPRCAERAAAQRRLVAVLPAAVSPSEDSRFASEVLLRIDQRLEQRHSCARWALPGAPRFAALAAAAAAATLALFFIDGRRYAGDVGTFTPRGANPVSAHDGAHAPNAAPVGLRVYWHASANPGARLELTSPLTAHSGDGFSFELWNATERPMQALVFGVDAKGGIHWFSPAWTTPDDRPLSLPVPARTARLALPHGVTPEAVAPGRFAIFAMFSPDVLAAQRLEELVAGRGLDALDELAHTRPDLVLRRVELTMQGVRP